MLGYGAINGLVTIVKATLPLALFSAESYASRTGLLLIPGTDGSCFTLAYAWLNHRLGIIGGMWVSTGLTLIVAGLALAMVREAGKAQDERNVEYPAAAVDQPIAKTTLLKSKRGSLRP